MPKPAKFEDLPDDEQTVESRALVTTEEPGDVDLTSRVYTSDAEFDRDDTMIPRLRLAQQLTPEVTNGDAEGGQWVLVGGEPVDDVIVVPISWGKSRELREEDDVVCSSNDAKTGRGQYGVGSKVNPDGLCDEVHCPMAQWTENAKTGKNNKPKCALIYSYVAWDETHQALVAIDMKSTATNAAKLMNTIVRAKGGFGKVAVKLGSSASKNAKGQPFFIPTVAIAKVDPEVLETAQALMP